VDRCRAVDSRTVPSTVYRTLDVLEQVGLVRHAHGPDGREEYHVRPTDEHGHMYCERCGGRWELGIRQAGTFVAGLERDTGFSVDVSHLSVVGVCAACRSRSSHR
jgi:Fur family transcriptional regulator, ferric uptake regulator